MDMLKTPASTASPSQSPAFLRPKLEAVWPHLEHLEATYPGFRTWFWDKVAPGIATGERRVFTRSGPGGIVGAVIAKSDPTERKLCTVWVSPRTRREGVASCLVDEAIDWLKDPRPLLTVPEERLAEMMPLLRPRGFELVHAIPSCYRKGRVEHVFNGRLVPRLDS